MAENMTQEAGPDRRLFLQAGVAGAGVALAAGLAAADLKPLELANTGPDRVPQKPFGKTGEKVSILGIGGHAIGLAATKAEGIRIVQEAVDAGVTFMDN